MKEKRINQMMKKYEKITLFNKIIAHVYYNDLFQDIYMTNKYVVRVVEFLRKFILKYENRG